VKIVIKRNDIESDEEPFIFNLQFDDNGELILGDGTKNKPVRISFSSKYMINFLREKGGVARLDCTCKINSDYSLKRNVFNKIPRFDKEIKEIANKIEENQFNKSQ
jgi:hypothetical protein